MPRLVRLTFAMPWQATLRKKQSDEALLNSSPSQWTWRWLPWIYHQGQVLSVATHTNCYDRSMDVRLKIDVGRSISGHSGERVSNCIQYSRQTAYFEQVFQNLANTGKYDMMPGWFALCLSFIWYFFQSINFFDINEHKCLNNLRRCFRPSSKEPAKPRMLQNRRRHEHLRRGGVVGCLERCKSVANLLENMDKFAVP